MQTHRGGLRHCTRSTLLVITSQNSKPGVAIRVRCRARALWMNRSLKRLGKVFLVLQRCLFLFGPWCAADAQVDDDPGLEAARTTEVSQRSFPKRDRRSLTHCHWFQGRDRSEGLVANEY